MWFPIGKMAENLPRISPPFKFEEKILKGDHYYLMRIEFPSPNYIIFAQWTWTLLIVLKAGVGEGEHAFT